MDIRMVYRRIRFELEMLKKSKQPVGRAQIIVESFYKQLPPVFVQKNRLAKEYDVMIVIPIFNAEEYLEECLDSVFYQETQYRFSVVAVDDGSTDNSGAILDRYADHENLTIIHQENRGYSGARNRALEHINGRYVMFVDSDDLLPKDAIETLLGVAYQNDADLVAGGFVRFSNEGILERVCYDGGTQLASASQIPGYTCMKVFRADLLTDFCFPVGFLFEDTVLSWLVFPLCRNIFTVDKIIYHYRSHGGSISSSHHKQNRCVDTYWITKYCLEEASKRGYSLDAERYMQYLQQCWVNYVRTRYLPEEIQESIYVLSRGLLNEYFSNQVKPRLRRLRMLHRAFQSNSFDAYRFVLDRWDCM